MANSIQNNKRVAKNTLYLYFRTLFVMAITIFTSRVILDVLGVDDYGIYNVVGGFVSMFSVLSGTLTAASQRYLAYELGKEEQNIGRIFSTTLIIHFILAIIILLLLESLGLWFVNYKMNIASERLYAANWVFQCSVLTFFINIISIPYNASIIAYERMSAFAYISIFEVVLKLVAVYLLYYLPYDSLIVYALFMLFVATILRLLYGMYCKRHFPECHLSASYDRRVFKEMLGFCGWNFVGSTAAVLNSQGINLLINLFFGVALNAARGIASQVDNAINTFVQNFMMALNPQITKSYAAKDFEYVNRMIILGTKFAFFLFWIICLPVYLNTDFILGVWLKKVPDYASLFIRLGLIYNLCQNLSQCLYTTMLATGNIKKYQIIVGGLSLMAFPVTYIFFRIGLPAEWGYWSMIIFSVICLVARLLLLKEMVPMFNPIYFLKKVVFPIAGTIFPSVVIAFLMHMYIPDTTWIKFIFESSVCVFVCAICIWYIGMSIPERNKLMTLVKNKLQPRCMS